MRPATLDAAGMLVAAAVRAPFALFWGPGCVARRIAHDFVWGPDAPPRRCSPPHDLYKISCEPPCYGCQSCWRRHA